MLTRAVRGAIAKGTRAAEDELPDIEDRRLPLIGRSPAMQDVYRVIARVVVERPDGTDFGRVGDRQGTGGAGTPRHGVAPQAPFVALNMAAIPRELIEAELFGHERGAFTGAQARSAGRFEQAAGGTLFLDEIGDMPIEAQTRLLRVLQSGEFTTVGGARTIRADVRIVAATNKDLAMLVAGGQFREDLFYRLNVVPISLPALRARRQDVALLARHFLDRAAEGGLPRKQLDAPAIAVLENYDWPGNVRELENIMRRIAVLSRDEADRRNDAPRGALGESGIGACRAVAIRASRRRSAHGWSGWRSRNPRALDDGTLYDRIIGEVERPLIEAILARHQHNQLRAARALGINRNTLRKRLDMLGIDMTRRTIGWCRIATGSPPHCVFFLPQSRCIQATMDADASRVSGPRTARLRRFGVTEFERAALLAIAIARRRPVAISFARPARRRQFS